MRLRFIHIFVALCLLAAGAAGASEQSELLYSQGLLEFHAGHNEKALELFDGAVKADGKDVYALYYRGVTYGALGNFEAAATDLRVALKNKPDLDQAALELGFALVKTGKYGEAVLWLEQAQRSKQLEAEASLHLGIAQLRLGRVDDARRNLARATEKNPELALPARYYQGVAEYESRNLPAANEHFTFVSASSPDSEMGREAKVFLQKIEAGTVPEVKRFELNGAVGFQYDSNVVLAPSNEDLKDLQGVSNQSDGRVTLAAGAVGVPWQNDRMRLTLGYDFFQSLHFDLTEFNLQDHRLPVVVTADAGPVQLGVLGQYDYYLLDNHSFLQQITSQPWLAVPEGDFGRTEVYYRLRWRDFRGSYDIRNALNHAPGVRQFFYLGSPQRYVSIGYRFDKEDPRRDWPENQAFAYDGHQVDAGAGFTLPADVGVELSYVFRYEDYAPESNGRRDNEHRAMLVARKWINDYVAVSAGYFGVFNDSNKDDFEYDRHIGSIALELRY
jgi:Tfp pilus assembly protein PilF